jgi:hypothetical protein
MDFQNQNMQAMNAAQQAKDTAVIITWWNSDIQAKLGSYKDKIYDICWIILNHISVLIVQGMVNDPSADIKDRNNF